MNQLSEELRKDTEKLNVPRERRKSERVFMYLPLEYRVADGPYAHGGHVINSSAGGFLIDCVQDMPIGATLNLELLFPKGFEFNNFEAETEIVWKEDRSEDGRERYQYGTRITQMSEDDQRKLKQLLTGRLQEKAREETRAGFVNFEMSRHPRYAVDLPVECSRINSPLSYAGRAINASEGGLMIYLFEKVEIGQHLKLTLTVGSGSDRDTIDMITQVVWIDIGARWAMEEYRVGVMVVDISSKDRLKLKDLIESLSG